MPRRLVPKRPLNPFHVCARSHNKERFDLPLDEVWSIMGDYLYLLAHGFNFKNHSFVLMPNHFHWLLTAPEGNLSEGLLYFMRETSREMNRLSGRINQTYGGRNRKTLIFGQRHFEIAYKYVYRNPVKARLCDRVEAYPFSTLHGLCGLNRLVVPIAEDQILFTPSFDEQTLSWLNTPNDPQHDEEIRLALRRPKFELKCPKRTERRHELEDNGAPLRKREPGTF